MCLSALVCLFVRVAMSDCSEPRNVVIGLQPTLSGDYTIEIKLCAEELGGVPAWIDYDDAGMQYIRTGCVSTAAIRQLLAVYGYSIDRRLVHRLFSDRLRVVSETHRTCGCTQRHCGRVDSLRSELARLRRKPCD